MRVEVLIFGPAAAAAGTDRVEVKVTETPTAREICGALVEQFPSLKFALAAPRLAVNHAFSAPDTPVRPGDEVALITLVSGG